VCKGDIVIEDDVWLGMGVKIMDGVHIGRGAIIGAGAVVTRDVPSAAVAVGVPAKVVKIRG
ncbi:acyltransferase, partial [bacterium]|nr:acyltransferase [bacterium]